MNDEILQAIDGLFKTLGSLEKKFGIPTGFFKVLFKENDWSFMIKTHAIIEAAVSQTLAAVLDERLLPVFQRLDLSDSTTGKITFLKHLGILDETQRKFVRKISELRNLVVHNINQVDFNLKTYIQSLDTNQLQSLLKVLIPRDVTSKVLEWRKKLALEDPKVAIWMGMVSILLRTEVVSRTAEIKKEQTELSLKLLEIELEQQDQQQSKSEG